MLGQDIFFEIRDSSGTFSVSFSFAHLLTAAKYFETLKGQVEIKKITFYIYSGFEFNSIPLTNGL